MSIMALNIGDKIPSLLGFDENGNEIKSADYKGKKLVIYFYPKDNTPGCTSQACSLRDNYEELLKNGYAILGVSADSADSHKNFIAKHNLPFPLIADVDKELIKTFGVWQEKKNFGKTYMGIVRTTFVIDEEGTIKEKIEGRKVDTKNHSSQILELK